MAKSNPSLADLSRMRREARKAVAEVSSVEAIEQEAKQSSKAETLQKSHLEETKPVEIKEQPISVLIRSRK